MRSQESSGSRQDEKTMKGEKFHPKSRFLLAFLPDDVLVVRRSDILRVFSYEFAFLLSARKAFYGLRSTRDLHAVYMWPSDYCRAPWKPNPKHCRPNLPEEIYGPLFKRRLFCAEVRALPPYCRSFPISSLLVHSHLSAWFPPVLKVSVHKNIIARFFWSFNDTIFEGEERTKVNRNVGYCHWEVVIGSRNDGATINLWLMYVCYIICVCVCMCVYLYCRLRDSRGKYAITESKVRLVPRLHEVPT